MHARSLTPMFDFITIRRLRFGSGVVLMVYIACHLANHAMGLVSLDAAEAMLRVVSIFWQSKIGTLLLYGAAAVHVALALHAIYQRRTLRLPPMELFRIVLGLWLPVLLIGHAVSARLEHELMGSALSYTRIVSSIWNNGSEWRQIGLLAPGWLHGVLGLNFALAHRGWFRRARLVLFAIALLLPVLSALGFVAMGRQIARQEAADGVPASSQVTASQNPRIAMLNQWRSGLLWGYAGIIGFAFAARGARNLIERNRKKLVAIAYPTKTIKVPRGWSILEASRAFHIPHAAMCGGAARCSTCRVRILSGQDHAPPPDDDERATLTRINAADDVRLACRLRPRGEMSVVPLVDADRPQFRQAQRRIEGARDIVMLSIDVINRDALARDHIADDLLFVMTRIVEAVTSAVRATGGTVSQIGHDSVDAIFDADTDAAARAAAIIDRALCDLDERLGSQWMCRAQAVISLHRGGVVVAEIGASETPAMLIVGDAYDEMQALRRAARESGSRFALSDVVLADLGATDGDRIAVTPSLRACFTNDLAAMGLTPNADTSPRWRDKAVNAAKQLTGA